MIQSLSCVFRKATMEKEYYFFSSMSVSSMVVQIVLIFGCFDLTKADTFHIVTSQDTPCPGEFSGVPCVSLQQYVSNPTGEDVNIECVSSAAQWNFLSIQQVYMRGINFFWCHGGMTFRNLEIFTMECINVQYSNNRDSRASNSPFTIIMWLKSI